MPGKFSYTPLPGYTNESEIPQMVVAINDVFSKIKEAFDVLGMCFGYRVTVSVASASSDTTVAHNLGVVPDGFAVVNQMRPLVVLNRRIGPVAVTHGYDLSIAPHVG